LGFCGWSLPAVGRFYQAFGPIKTYQRQLGQLGRFYQAEKANKKTKQRKLGTK
jgi:hypothetical protein